MKYMSLSDFKGKFKRTISFFSEAGYETLEDLLLTDTLYLSKLVSVSEETLRKSLLSAELQSLGISSDISDDIAEYGDIYRASELASLGSENIKKIHSKVSKQSKVITDNIEEFEKIILKIPKMTLGESTVKAYASEEETTPIQHETIEAMKAEDPVITMQNVNNLMNDLEDILNNYKSKTVSLSSKQGEPIDLFNLQSLVASLHEEINVAASNVINKVDPSMNVTQLESKVSPLFDERLEIEEQITEISDKIVLLQDQLSALKTQKITFHEDLGLTISEEKEPVAARGEN